MRFIRHIACLWVLLAAVSCTSSMFDYDFEGDKLDSTFPSEWVPVKCDIDDICLKSFKVMAKDNDCVLGDIIFTYAGHNKYEGHIKYYHLEERKLVTTVNALAARIEVNGENLDSPRRVCDFNESITYRLFASDGQYKDYFFSIIQDEVEKRDVPIVCLTITNKINDEDWTQGYMRISGEGSEYGDESHSIQIRYRSKKSSSIAKKSYTIKMDEKAGVLGMPRHKRWVLLSNGMDRTLLRNRVAFEIAKRTSLAWTPRTRYCDLVVNGSFKGLYMAAEQIRIGTDRVNITRMSANDKEGEAVTGGFLLECDREKDNYSFATAIREIPINIKDPDKDVLQEEQINYLKNYLWDIEKCLFSTDEIDPAYRDLIDINSFIDVWITMEIAHGSDALQPSSVWYYKDRGGKLMAGPVWDFETSTFPKRNDFFLYDYTVWDFSKNERSLWYGQLFRDPYFKAKAKERWEMFYPSMLTIPDYIDEQAALIKDAATRNNILWTAFGDWNGDERMTWEESVENMKINFLERLNSLNGVIEKW